LRPRARGGRGGLRHPVSWLLAVRRGVIRRVKTHDPFRAAGHSHRGTDHPTAERAARSVERATHIAERAVLSTEQAGRPRNGPSVAWSGPSASRRERPATRNGPLAYGTPKCGRILRIRVTPASARSDQNR